VTFQVKTKQSNNNNNNNRFYNKGFCVCVLAFVTSGDGDKSLKFWQRFYDGYGIRRAKYNYHRSMKTGFEQRKFVGLRTSGIIEQSEAHFCPLLTLS